VGKIKELSWQRHPWEGPSGKKGRKALAPKVVVVAGAPKGAPKLGVEPKGAPKLGVEPKGAACSTPLAGRASFT